MNPLTSVEFLEFIALVDARAIRPDTAVFYRAGYLESMVRSMAEVVPGVAEYVRGRMTTLVDEQKGS
jgi:hypothetical protein